MNIIDTHAHLDQLDHLDEDLHNAVQAGVVGVVAVSIGLDSCRRNLEIRRTRQHPLIYVGMGVHPSEADKEEAQECLSLIHENRDALTAIGEIGLDFWYKNVRKNEEKKQEQRRVFRLFLEAARDLSVPAVVHSRGAWQECFETVKDVGVKKAVFHWYSGPVDVLDDLLAEGYYVSASPSLAYSPQSRAAMERAPIERTLIETDCPVYYKDPQTGEGFQAQPRDVVRTLKIYAQLKGLEEKDALERLNRNAKEFFGIKD
ncbi:MAG: hypothetical protein A3D87_05980 [Omnitrophica WOR_2 bacterium RIFCSPHIGHO2_02_FULL_50_17]|nr:MAG: hypothetical protein A3D87_05980 [Omnitrophica WOR_2 bacterium RIFCSPHIGHO2_02_FULL_50_17]